MADENEPLQQRYACEMYLRPATTIICSSVPLEHCLTAVPTLEEKNPLQKLNVAETLRIWEIHKSIPKEDNGLNPIIHIAVAQLSAEMNAAPCSSQVTR